MRPFIFIFLSLAALSQFPTHRRFLQLFYFDFYFVFFLFFFISSAIAIPYTPDSWRFVTAVSKAVSKDQNFSYFLFSNFFLFFHFFFLPPACTRCLTSSAGTRKNAACWLGTKFFYFSSFFSLPQERCMFDSVLRTKNQNYSTPQRCLTKCSGCWN
jgi:hypothetical protein